MTSKIIRTFRKNRKVGNFTSERLWEPCSFGWEMVGDEDWNSWEMVRNLLIVGTLYMPNPSEHSDVSVKNLGPLYLLCL